MSRVYTGGTFDLFHAGHVQFLSRCRGLVGAEGTVVVALNCDEFVARYKGRPPVIDYVGREAVLRACRFVDHVIPNFGNENSAVVIDVIKPQIIAIGDDWRDKDYFAQMGFDQAWLDARGIALVYLPYSYASQGLPSSKIRAQLDG